MNSGIDVNSGPAAVGAVAGWGGGDPCGGGMGFIGPTVRGARHGARPTAVAGDGTLDRVAAVVRVSGVVVAGGEL